MSLCQSALLYNCGGNYWTNKGCLIILTGEMDHLPEIAFYMVGPIEEVTKKAERLAEERR